VEPRRRTGLALALGATTTFETGFEFGPFAGWQATDVSAGSDNNHRLLWSHEDGRASFWVVSPAGDFLSGFEFGPFPGWTPRAIGSGADNRTSLLWGNQNNQRTSLWLLAPGGAFDTGFEFAP
jgi:hypothetical protein